MASVDPESSSRRDPKWVVLRLKVSDFDDRKGEEWNEFTKAIRAYLLFAGRPTTEDEINKHHAHIELFQSPEFQQTSFHIIMDMEKSMSNENEFRKLPHEIYRIRRNERDTL